MKKRLLHFLSKTLVIILILAFIAAAISGCVYVHDSFVEQDNQGRERRAKTEEEITAEHVDELRDKQEAQKKAQRQETHKSYVPKNKPDDNGNDDIVTDEYGARKALQNMQSRLGIQDADSEFRIERTISDGVITTYYFQQYYDGICVPDGTISMDVNQNGDVLSLQGDYQEISGLDTSNLISQNEATALATDYMNQTLGIPTGEMQIWSDNKTIRNYSETEYVILYEICFDYEYSDCALYTVAVDAQSGEILGMRDNIEYDTVSVSLDGQTSESQAYNYQMSAISAGNSSLTKAGLDASKTRNVDVYESGENHYILKNQERNIEVYESISNNLRSFSNDKQAKLIEWEVPEESDETDEEYPQIPNKSGVDALYNLCSIQNYFSDHMANHNIAETLQGELLVAVNVEQFKGSNFTDNACMSGNDKMIFGKRQNATDASGNLAPEYSFDLDVVAHEYTHGLEHRLTNLYNFFPWFNDRQKSTNNALGEAFADIFGSLVEASEYGIDISKPEAWIIGAGLRDIADAPNDAKLMTDYSKYKEYETDCHYTCTLTSYPAYLMASGNGDAGKITPFADMEQAWFGALCDLNSKSTFLTVREYLERYAYEHAFPDGQIESVLDAFDMVGVVEDPDVRMQLDTGAELNVYDVNNRLLSDYHLTITPVYSGSGSAQPVFSQDISEAHYKLSGVNPGYYVFSFSDVSDPDLTEDFRVLLNDEVSEDLTTYEALGEFATSIKAPSASIGLVLDYSGSMAGEPLKNAKEAAIAFVETVHQKNPNTRISIVAFSDSAQEVVSGSRDTDYIIDTISSYYDGGGTDMYDGIDLCYSLITQNQTTQAPIMIVMGDGLPNNGPCEGYSYAVPIINRAEEIKNAGVTIYTLGFFHNLIDLELEEGTQLMEAIASSGYHYNITDVSSIQSIFDSMALESTGDNMLVIKVECPVDVTVKHGDEILSSDPANLNTETSFGIMTFEGEDHETKILRLNQRDDYEIMINGNGVGKMDYSISYPNESGSYHDVRTVKNVQITPDTTISTRADKQDSKKDDLLDTLSMKVDRNGDGVFDEEYLLAKNGRYKTSGQKWFNYCRNILLTVLAVWVLGYILWSIINRKKKLQLPSTASVIATIVGIILLCGVTFASVSMYQSLPNRILREFRHHSYETAYQMYDRGIESNEQMAYLNLLFDKYTDRLILDYNRGYNDREDWSLKADYMDKMGLSTIAGRLR